MDSSTNTPNETQLEDVLRAFIAHTANDSALQDFANGQDFTTHYVLSNPEIGFHIRFCNGQVTGNLGPPPAPAEVSLKMKAEILDGMLTGRINPMRAAMGGKLSFSGDMRLAMGMQRIQADLSRLYQQARTETGLIAD